LFIGGTEEMKRELLRGLLQRVKSGDLEVEEALSTFVREPTRNLGHSRLDLHREMRNGFGEVVYAEGKKVSELIDIVEALLSDLQEVLITRLRDDQLVELRDRFPTLNVFENCGVAYQKQKSHETKLGSIGILTAGTSDSRVAEEAAACSEFFDLEVVKTYDVGVAGIHRLIEVLPLIEGRDVLVVAAGMEGALPGIVAGLTPVPVIAVPTSVGYGATFGGLTAFLSMLVSCSPGLTVVNIDNGFGAALAAAKLIRHLRGRSSKSSLAEDRLPQYEAKRG
jgi:NCAIR mutase (PurE)-related protein